MHQTFLEIKLFALRFHELNSIFIKSGKLFFLKNSKWMLQNGTVLEISSAGIGGSVNPELEAEISKMGLVQIYENRWELKDSQLPQLILMLEKIEAIFIGASFKIEDTINYKILPLKRVKSNYLKRIADLKVSECRLNQELQPIIFNRGEANLSTENMDVLIRMILVICNYGYEKIYIYSSRFIDEDVSLSESRASNVIAFIVDRGLSKEKISIINTQVGTAEIRILLN